MPRKTQIQVRRDTASNWTSVNPVLSSGEPGVETDTGKLKLGDGTTAWSSLTYSTDGSKITGTTLSSSIVASSLTSVGTLVNLSVTNTITGSISGNAATATKSTNIVGGGQGRIPVQSAADTTGFTGAPAAAGQVLGSTATPPYAAWGYPTPYKMLSGTTTGGAVSVTFSTSFPSGVVPIVVATVLSTNTKPEIFVLNTVDNASFTGQVWSSSGTASPYNNFVTANGRTIHWIAIQLTP